MFVDMMCDNGVMMGCFYSEWMVKYDVFVFDDMKQYVELLQVNVDGVKKFVDVFVLFYESFLVEQKVLVDMMFCSWLYYGGEYCGKGKMKGKEGKVVVVLVVSVFVQF